MSAAITSTAASAPFFYLFKSPLLLFPSYEIGRILFNTIWKTVYRKSVESEFSERALLAGVHKVSINTQSYLHFPGSIQLRQCYPTSKQGAAFRYYIKGVVGQDYTATERFPTRSVGQRVGFQGDGYSFIIHPFLYYVNR
jgi:hypothetical protein